MSKDTRDRILNSAASQLQRYGLHGASLNGILDEGGAPRGSLYYFFPGGKEQLALEATVRGVAVVTQVLEEMIATKTLDKAVSEYFGAAAHELEESGFVFGCPVTPIIMDIDEASAALAAVCRDAMTKWRETYEVAFVAAGMPSAKAHNLAVLAIAALEGSLIMARAARDISAIITAGDEVAELVRQSLASAKPKRGAKRR
jgi:TetR/AcrR family transcriptional regulator, lmrAB and yxaGH operons repressor